MTARRDLDAAWAEVVNKAPAPWTKVRSALVTNTATHLAAVYVHGRPSGSDEFRFQLKAGVLSKALCDFEGVALTVGTGLRHPGPFEADPWHWQADLHQLDPAHVSPWLAWPRPPVEDRTERVASLATLTDFALAEAASRMSDEWLYTNEYTGALRHQPGANYPRWRRALALAIILGDKAWAEAAHAALQAASDVPADERDQDLDRFDLLRRDGG